MLAAGLLFGRRSQEPQVRWREDRQGRETGQHEQAAQGSVPPGPPLSALPDRALWVLGVF